MMLLGLAELLGVGHAVSMIHPTTNLPMDHPPPKPTLTMHPNPKDVVTNPIPLVSTSRMKMKTPRRSPNYPSP